ncbi:MAG: tetratricopeptide repeat protein [Pseudomonadota bacterium]
MSVINQMLRDLDSRQASEQERAGLPPGLRTLPAKEASRSQSWRMLAIGIGIGAISAGLVAGLLLMPGSANKPALTPRPVPAPEPPRPPVLPAAPPVVAVPPLSESAPADIGEMKLSTLLGQAQAVIDAPETAAPPPTPVEDKPAVKPVPRAMTSEKPPVAKPVSPVKPPPADKPAPAPREIRPPAVEIPVADTHIDKRPKGGQSHDMAETEYRKGIQAVRRGDATAAQTALQKAVELDPGHAKGRQALLSVLVGGRKWAEARQVAQDGLALDPAQHGWAVILARLQFEQGDTAGAVATLERHAPHAGGNADYQGLFAYLLQKEQRPAEAAERFKLALALRPQEGRWWFGLGVALEESGNGAEARAAFAKARATGTLTAEMAATVEQKLSPARP